jgi:hypothetical protein
MGEPKSVEAIMEATGCDPATAAEIHTFETWESEDDVVVVDEHGRPLDPQPEPSDADLFLRKGPTGGGP